MITENRTAQPPLEKKRDKANRSWLNNTALNIAALVAVVFLLFSSFIFSGKDGMMVSSDQMNGLDSKVFFETSISKFHQFPMWFTSRLGGTPTIDAMFGDVMYIPTWLINTVLPVHKAIGYKMILHVLLAGVFFFLMARKGFKTPVWVATAAAILYMLNPQFVSHIYPGHDGKMFVIAWLPFMVWRAKVIFDKPSLLNSTLLGLGIAMSLFTSHIQMAYFVLIGLFLYWVSDLALKVHFKKMKPAISAAFSFWGAVAIGLGASLIQLYPSFMYVREAFSVRGIDRGFEHAASWSLHWPEVFSLWVPEFGNHLSYYWGANPFKLNTEYAGLMITFLAVIAVVAKPSFWRIFWVAIGAVAIGFALGANTPFFNIMYAVVPGVKKFRAPSMIMFWFSFATSMLTLKLLKDIAEDNFKKLSESAKKRWSKGLLIAVGACFALSLLFSSKGFVSGLFSSSILDPQKKQVFDLNFSQNFLPNLWIWFLFVAGSLFLFYFHIKGKLSAKVTIVIFLILGVIDVLRVNSGFIEVKSVLPYISKEPVLERLASQMSDSPFRVFPLPGSLNSNGAGVHHLESVDGFHDNELRWYRDFRGDQQNRNFYDRIVGFNADGSAYLRSENLSSGNPFLNIANVRYLLYRGPDGTIVPIENREALGRVSFASNYIVADSLEILSKLHSMDYDYKSIIAFSVQPQEKVSPSIDSNPPVFAADWQEYTPNYRSVKVNTDRDGFLRISEVYYPGWKVKIDGKETRVYQADVAWMGVFLPKGDHEVEMIAQSLYLDKAKMVSYPFIVFLFIYWGTLIFLKSRRKRAVEY